MDIPQYSDLGSSARDLFTKGYNFGAVKLGLKTKTKNGVEFNLQGSSNSQAGTSSGNVEAKYTWPRYGLVFKEKWDTSNEIHTTVESQDHLITGLKLALGFSFSPRTGKKSSVASTTFKNRFMTASADLRLETAGTIVDSGVVFGYQGWLAGVNTQMDAKGALARTHFTLGMQRSDYSLQASVADGKDFSGLVYQRMSDDLEAGTQVLWTAGSNVASLGVAAKYQLDKDTTVQAQVNSQSQVGIAYACNLRADVKLTVSALVNAKSINRGGHKLGLGLDINV